MKNDNQLVFACSIHIINLSKHDTHFIQQYEMSLQ